MAGRIMQVLFPLLTVLLAVKSAPIQTPRKTYNMDKLVRVHPMSLEQVVALEKLQNHPSMKLDFWKVPHLNTSVDIMFPYICIMTSQSTCHVLGYILPC